MAEAKASGASAPAPPVLAEVRARWLGGTKYAVGKPGGPTATIDGDNVAGPGPVVTLLGALAACSSIDVIGYLEKRRTPAEQLEVVVSAIRSGDAPRRVRSATLEFQIHGAGIHEAHAERAIALSVERYCSVGASLAPDIKLDLRLALNGQPARRVRPCAELAPADDEAAPDRMRPTPK